MLGLFGKKSIRGAGAKETVAFCFELPPCRRQESKLSDLPSLWQRLDAAAAESVHLLVELNRFLHELNGTYISSVKRFDITSRCSDYAGAAIRRIFIEHQTGKALPESEPKREALTAAIHCITALADSYKRVIKNDSNYSTKQTKTAKRRVIHSMQVTLELIQAQQRLKALRYQRIGQSTWRDCNAIFFALRHAEASAKRFKPMIGLTRDRSQSLEGDSKAPKSSPEEIYTAIQLYGLIDPNSLSLQQLVIVENAIRQFVRQMHPDTINQSQSPRNCVIVSQNHEGPPTLGTENEDGYPAVFIDIEPLAVHLRENYKNLSARFNGIPNSAEKSAGPGLDNTEDLERLLALKNMLDKLQETRRADTRRYPDSEQDLYVYNGFTAGFRLLNANKTQLGEHGDLRNQLTISLAQRSAVLADSSQENSLTQWEIINESGGGILLRTKESKFIKSLFIGQMIVFAKNKTDLSAPACGWIVRICRQQQTEIEISVKTLASQIESAAVQTEFLRKNNLGMPGILVLDAGEKLQLILHQSHRLSPGSQVYIHRGGKAYVYTLGDIALIQREFVLYHLEQG